MDVDRITSLRARAMEYRRAGNAAGLDAFAEELRALPGPENAALATIATGDAHALRSEYDEALDAFDAARESFRQEGEEHGAAICTARIGLHAGPVVAGVVGAERLQFDVWGDTVNVASRMETTGASGRIQVSAAFADALTPEDWALTPRDGVEVKGKGLLRTFWLDAASA